MVSAVYSCNNSKMIGLLAFLCRHCDIILSTVSYYHKSWVQQNENDLKVKDHVFLVFSLLGNYNIYLQDLI